MGSSPAIIAVANHKGGVGKTTTAVNLSAGLARRGLRVLLVDLDTQGSATATLLGRDADDGAGLARCLEREQPLDELVVPTRTPRLFLVPSGDAMASVDVTLANAMGRERVLTRCLEQTLPDTLDVVVIDTAPYLGLLTVNGLVAADHALVPVTCEYLPILGLRLLNQFIDKLRDRAGARIDVLGYLLTMYDRRERITEEVEDMLRGAFGELVFDQPIRVSTRHKASASHRKTIFEFDRPGGRGRLDYEQLTDDVLNRTNLLSLICPANDQLLVTAERHQPPACLR